MVICKLCKKSKSVFEVDSIKHCFHSLADAYMLIDQKEEDSKGFWKKIDLRRYSYQTGFISGINAGVKMMKYPPEIKIVDYTKDGK